MKEMEQQLLQQSGKVNGWSVMWQQFYF